MSCHVFHCNIYLCSKTIHKGHSQINKNGINQIHHTGMQNSYICHIQYTFEQVCFSFCSELTKFIYHQLLYITIYSEDSIRVPVSLTKKMPVHCPVVHSTHKVRLFLEHGAVLVLCPSRNHQ